MLLLSESLDIVPVSTRDHGEVTNDPEFATPMKMRRTLGDNRMSELK